MLAADDVVGAGYRVSGEAPASVYVAVVFAEQADQTAQYQEFGHVGAESGPECVPATGLVVDAEDVYQQFTGLHLRHPWLVWREAVRPGGWRHACCPIRPVEPRSPSPRPACVGTPKVRGRLRDRSTVRPRVRGTGWRSVAARAVGARTGTAVRSARRMDACYSTTSRSVSSRAWLGVRFSISSAAEATCR